MGTETMTPVDATHVGPGGQAYKYAGASCWIWTGNLWSLIRDLPAQAVEIKREWDGEGLPPIGCEFERRFIDIDPSSWAWGKTIAHGHRTIFYSDRNGDEWSHYINDMELRPVCSGKQIAAEQREAAILAISTDAGSPIPNASQRAVAERLIDAGWIKR